MDYIIMTKLNNNGVYIQSMEAKAIYNEMNRGIKANPKFVGLVPNSLALMKMVDAGLEVEKVKGKDKFTSKDVINIKFTLKVDDIDAEIKYADSKVKKYKKELKNEKLKESERTFKEECLNDATRTLQNLKSLKKSNAYVESVNLNRLRKVLYENGFTRLDAETGEIIEYKIYGRSSAKSRVGEVLAIRKELYEPMIKWARLNLPFQDDQEVDLPSLLAYESLTTSSIEDTVKIKPNQILLIDDVQSKFTKKMKEVIKNENGQLDVVENDNISVVNDIWDGQSLLDESIFKSVGRENKGMMLLRQGMFKSCSFNTRITDYLESVAEAEGINFNTWKLKDMFGNEILAKNVRMIVCPSSLKILKFAELMEGNTNEEKQAAIYKHWLKFVGDEGSSFGIVKSEKASKIQIDGAATVNQMSYQMINSLLMDDKADLLELMQFELNYITSLKTNDKSYIAYLEQTADFSNANEMYINLYKHNPEVVKTDLFRNYKKTKINTYLTKLKSGKVKMENADYAVLFSNPDLMLKTSHSALNYKDEQVVSDSLQSGEAYCKKYNDGSELVAFRSPHSSPSSVLSVINKYYDAFKWFNLSDEIIIINNTNDATLDQLAGADMDSDQVLLIHNEKLYKIAQKCKKYLIVRNGISADKKKYQLNMNSMYQVDAALSKSGQNIGEITNLAQLSLSIMWDAMHKGDEEIEQQMLELVDVCTVLSGIAIDEAKKRYDITMVNEIKKIRSNLHEITKDKGLPLFFEHVKKNDVTTGTYETPMDWLQQICKVEIDKNHGEKGIKFLQMLKQPSNKKANLQQAEEMIAKVNKAIKNIDAIQTKKGNIKDSDSLKQELHTQLEEAYFKLDIAIPNKLTEETMHHIVKSQFMSNEKYKVKKYSYLFSALYKKHPELFMSILY